MDEVLVSMSKQTLATSLSQWPQVLRNLTPDPTLTSPGPELRFASLLPASLSV